MKRAIATASMLLVASVPLVGAAAPRPIGDTTVFARVGQPGMPEGVVVQGNRVYVGTHTSVRGNAGGVPSKIFVYDLDSHALVDEIVIQGQDLSVTHGVLAMAFDAAGRLYVVDRNPGRVVRIDPTSESGTQTTYATVPDLRACRPVVGPDAPCAPTTLDEPTFADYIAFDDAGRMYLTDLQAATIFRVLPGGGPAEIWYQDARFDGLFGLNGIAVDPTGTRLYFAMTGSQQPGSLAQGIIYTLPIVDAPRPEDLQVFHAYAEPAAGPDGIAFGASGNLYVALAGSNQVSILDEQGNEMARFPDAVANAQAEVPYDLPASIAFDGEGSLLLTNQSFFAANPDHWVVFDVYVADTALPLRRPVL